MYDWMHDLPNTGPGSLAYQAYFNEDQAHDGLHRLDAFPNSRIRFAQLFGAR